MVDSLLLEHQRQLLHSSETIVLVSLAFVVEKEVVDSVLLKQERELLAQQRI